jgi:Cu/Zn superoxide dismutase
MRNARAVIGFTLLWLAWAIPSYADRRFQATLTGAQQVPVANSTGTGIGTVLLNTAETQITVDMSFSGLTSNANMAHIHGAAAAGSNAGVLFDFSGVTPAATSGAIPQQTFAITPTQVTQLKAGQFYFNIHTANFGGGEIRGQIMAAPPQKFAAVLTGAQQVPPVVSSGTGTGTVLLNAAEDQITVNMSFSGLTSNATMAHIHGPAAAGANAGVLFDFTAVTPNATSGSIPEQTFAITPTQVAQLKAGLFYFNIHTINFGGGEIRGQIGLAPIEKFTSTLSGAQQVPSVSSAGTGTGTVLLNAAGDQITVNMSFTGLTSNASAAHIHGPAFAGASAGVLFDFSAVTPAATSGSIPQQTFAITPTQVTQLRSGQFYFNIHTTNFGGGEIRGQILLAPVRKFTATLDGAHEVPSVPSGATGAAIVLLSGTEEQITTTATFANLGSNASAAHIHGPAFAGSEAGVLFPLDGVVAALSGLIPDQTFAITSTQVTELKAGQHYFNIHSANFPDGEIRGQIGALPLLTVTTGGTGSASAPISSNPAGISCGGDCTEPYDSGTTVTSTAGTPSAGSFFAGWTGAGCAGTGTCVITLTTDTAVTAVYTLTTTSIAFTDDPLTTGSTLVKAAHINELRTAVNTLRTSNGLGAFTFTDPSLAAGTTIKVVHITELRTALGAVYVQRGRAVPTYSDPSITANVTKVKGLHISELRMAVRLVE